MTDAEKDALVDKIIALAVEGTKVNDTCEPEILCAVVLSVAFGDAVQIAKGKTPNRALSMDIGLRALQAGKSAMLANDAPAMIVEVFDV